MRTPVSGARTRCYRGTCTSSTTDCGTCASVSYTGTQSTGSPGCLSTTGGEGPSDGCGMRTSTYPPSTSSDSWSHWWDGTRRTGEWTGTETGCGRRQTSSTTTVVVLHGSRLKPPPLRGRTQSLGLSRQGPLLRVTSRCKVRAAVTLPVLGLIDPIRLTGGTTEYT